MSQANSTAADAPRTDVRIGLVFEDQRTGDHRQVIYVDSRVVLVRDEMGSTTLVPRGSFETHLGLRYQVRHDADPEIDGGQYGRLRDRLAEYENEDGRKAAHKVEALREALDLLAGRTDGEADDAAAEASGGGTGAKDADEEVAFEEIPGIGPETARKLRAGGLVTEDDVRTASDEELLAVPGIGPANLENVREFVD